MDMSSYLPLWIRKRAVLLHVIISTVIRILILLGAIQFAFANSWLLMSLSVGVFVLTFLPAAIEHNFKVNLPLELELLMVLFVFATLFLGDAQRFYFHFWWWDAFLHALSGLLLGFCGFLIVFTLNYEEKIHLDPIFVALFTFTFAVAMGAMWEIVEFSIDLFFGLSMQNASLADTMLDLILDSFGAFVVAALGYQYVKLGKAFIVDTLLLRFVQKNPRLFERKHRIKKGFRKLVAKVKDRRTKHR